MVGGDGASVEAPKEAAVPPVATPAFGEVKAAPRGSPGPRLDAGKFLVLLTWTLVTATHYVTLTGIFGSATYGALFPRAIRKAYHCTSALVLLCHIRAVFADPGGTDILAPVDPPAAEPPPAETAAVSASVPNDCPPRICKLCGRRWKPPRAHHCRKCERCIFRMDHHCNWIDNCVGICNQKYFILFLVYALGMCVFQFGILAVVAGAAFFWRAHQPAPSWKSMCTGLALLVEVIISFHMALEFLVDQYDALRTNSTLVESHQHAHGRSSGFWQQLRTVFGAASSALLWPFPVAPALVLDLQEPVYLDRAVAAHLRAQMGRWRHAMAAAASSVSADDLRRAGCKLVVGGAGAGEAAVRGGGGAALRRSPSDRSFGVDAGGVSGAGVPAAVLPGAPTPLAGAPAAPGAFGEDPGLWYRNMYIRPSADIGVDLDNDASQFVRWRSDGGLESEGDETSDEGGGQLRFDPRRRSSDAGSSRSDPGLTDEESDFDDDSDADGDEFDGGRERAARGGDAARGGRAASPAAPAAAGGPFGRAEGGGLWEVRSPGRARRGPPRHARLRRGRSDDLSAAAAAARDRRP